MSDQDVDGFVPVPVPLGDGRHDIGDERRAAIVQRLISDWSHDPDLPPEKVRQLAMWAAASVRALFHELGTLQDTMTPAATSPDVAALDAEKLVERYCRFNCDLESSCRCAVHEVYRALHAELLTTQQWARAEHMDVLRLEAYQAATRAALQRVEQEQDEARQVIQDLLKEFYSVFTEEPLPNGDYVHLGICSGSRRVPPGQPKSGCVCFTKVKADRARLAQVEAALKANEGVCPHCDLPRGGGICKDENAERVLICHECAEKVADFYGRRRERERADAAEAALKAMKAAIEGGKWRPR